MSLQIKAARTTSGSLHAQRALDSSSGVRCTEFTCEPLTNCTPANQDVCHTLSKSQPVVSQQSCHEC
jgi:hypothetical protein